MSKPKYWEQGKSFLKKKDKTLKKIIDAYPGHLKARKDPFFSLARSIVGQQISVKAADSVWNKLMTKVKKMNPNSIKKIKRAQLSQCGLSKQKVNYLKILSASFLNKTINIVSLKKMNDEEAIQHLIQLKGVGRWTAEMFLFFNQLRPNIFPVQDIGFLKAISKQYKLTYPPSKEKLIKLKQKWDPYCTIATWYLWRSIDPVPVNY
jgi:DNA-3-methyladenine glycosylase II